MPRVRQKRLAKALVLNEISNEPKTNREVLLSVDYPKTVAEHKSTEVIAQKGVQEALQEEAKTMLEAAKKLGLTPEKLIKKVNVLLDAKKITKLLSQGGDNDEGTIVSEEEDKQAIDKGLTHALKIGVGGGYAAEKTVGVNFNINAESKDFTKHKEIKERYEQELKEALQQD